MTVTAQTPSVQYTITSGNVTSLASDPASVTFSITFKYLATSEVVANFTDITDGSDTVLTETTHYTLSAAGDSGTFTFTATGAALMAAGDLLTFTRSMAFSQATDYAQNDELDAETLEGNFDKTVMISQQLKEELDRRIHFAKTATFDSTAEAAAKITDLKADRASKFLGFDTDGNITTSVSTNTHIDSTSPASGHVLIHNGTKYVNVAILDSDTMSGASATTVASSESIKAYVDAEILTEDTIAELNDTTITGTPADNEFLAYDSGASKWINQTATEAGLGTAATKDVGIGNTNVLAANAAVADNDFLRVDGTSVEGRTASEVVSDLSAMTTNSDSTLSAGVDINMSTTGKIAQKGAFLQSSTHQALFLGA